MEGQMPEQHNPIPPITPTTLQVPTGVTSAPQTPQVPDYLTAIPEQYRSDPRKLVSEWETYKREIDQLRPVADWYKRYEPWFQEHRNHRFVSPEEYELLDTARRQGRQPTQPVPQTPQQPTVDWDDPNAARQTYETLQQRFATREQDIDGLKQQLAATQTEFQSARQTIMDLMNYQQQLYDLERQDLHEYLGTKMQYQPRVNPQAVVNYALEHQLKDLRQAAEHLYGAERQRQRDEQLMERARQDALAEFQNRQRTTEMTSGVPNRAAAAFRLQSDVPRGYGNAGRDQLLQMMADGRRRE